MEEYKSGFAAIVGRPNVGKSTLLNHVLQQKIAIISDKPQTTRNRITGVYTRENMQIVFLDTPGIHKPRHKLGEFMVRQARDSLNEVDVVLYVVDASASWGPGEDYMVKTLRELSTPVILVLNKIDRVKKPELLPLIDFISRRMSFAAVVPVSAVTGENVDSLLDEMAGMLSPGPQYYPDDMITDQPEKMIVAEIIREKVLHCTREEVPHSLAVVVGKMTEKTNGILYIEATVFVEQKSQKGIIIGKNGSMLKEIGRNARQELEAMLDTRIYIDIWVKVKQDWRKKEEFVRHLGFNRE